MKGLNSLAVFRMLDYEAEDLLVKKAYASSANVAHDVNVGKNLVCI